MTLVNSRNGSSLLIFVNPVFEYMSSNYLFIFFRGFTFVVGGINLNDNQLKSSISQHIKNDPTANSTITSSASQKSHFIKVLEDCTWKINGDEGTANKLGMPSSTLRSKMKKLNINGSIKY